MEKSKCQQGRGEIWNLHTLLVGIENGAATLENSLAVAQNVKQRATT